MKVHECQGRFQSPTGIKNTLLGPGLNIVNNGLAVDSFSRENAKKVSFGGEEGDNFFNGLLRGSGLGVVLGIAAGVATGGLSLVPYYLALGASTLVGGAVGAHKDINMKKKRLWEEEHGLRRPRYESDYDEQGSYIHTEPEEAVVVKKRRRHKARKSAPAKKALPAHKATAAKVSKSSRGSTKLTRPDIYSSEYIQSVLRAGTERERIAAEIAAKKAVKTTAKKAVKTVVKKAAKRIR